MRFFCVAFHHAQLFYNKSLFHVGIVRIYAIIENEKSTEIMRIDFDAKSGRFMNETVTFYRNDLNRNQVIFNKNVCDVEALENGNYLLVANCNYFTEKFISEVLEDSFGVGLSGFKVVKINENGGIEQIGYGDFGLKSIKSISYDNLNLKIYVTERAGNRVSIYRWNKNSKKQTLFKQINFKNGFSPEYVNVVGSGEVLISGVVYRSRSWSGRNHVKIIKLLNDGILETVFENENSVSIPQADQYGNFMVLSGEPLQFCYKFVKIPIETSEIRNSEMSDTKTGSAVQATTKIINLLIFSNNSSKNTVHVPAEPFTPTQIKQLLSKQKCFCRRPLLDYSNQPPVSSKLDSICREFSNCKTCAENSACYGAVQAYKTVFVAPETGEFECPDQNQCSLNACLCDLRFAVRIGKLVARKVLKIDDDPSVVRKLEGPSFGYSILENSCLSVQTFISALTVDSGFQSRLGLLDKPDRCCGESPDWKLYSSRTSVCINGQLN